MLSMNPQAGQELKKIRESRGISLEQAAQDMRLRSDLLRELEDGGDDRNMPEVYRKLSLRMYARYLDVAFNPTRDDKNIELSPVDGCVELAYSEKLSDEAEPKKRRVVGTGTILAATAVLVLATGLWSLNAKISRLNLDEKQARPAATAEPEVALTAPPAVDESVRLEDSVFLTLTPAESGTNVAPDAP